MGEENRNLTDADVRAVVDEMEKRMVDRFYGDIGRGVWAIAWRVIVLALLGLASYGSIKEFKF